MIKRKKPEIDLITGFLWRSGWDLNPRAHETHDGFRVHAVMTSSVPLHF